jgi:3-oxoadipate CoA-transferase, alpha subunit
MINKIVRSMAEAMEGIKDGSTVLLGGFATIGEPRALLEGLVEQGAKDLTIIANTAGRPDDGLSRLIALGRVRKVMATFARRSSSLAFHALRDQGKIEFELLPQGTLAEGLHAAGSGVPAYYTATGVGTQVAEGKEHREFNGRTFILERALPGDVGLVEAWQADRWGNLTYRSVGRNFNPLVAMAAALTIVQAQHVVELGELHPDHIVTPGIFVNRVLHVPYGDPPH